MILFIILGFSKSIIAILDSRYILLVIIVLLGAALFILGILEFEEVSLKENILDIIISIFTGDFEFTTIFIILFGLFLLITGIIGLINGPDSIGMEQLPN